MSYKASVTVQRETEKIAYAHERCNDGHGCIVAESAGICLQASLQKLHKCFARLEWNSHILPCSCANHTPRPGGESCKSDVASLGDLPHSKHLLCHLQKLVNFCYKESLPMPYVLSRLRRLKVCLVLSARVPYCHRSRPLSPSGLAFVCSRL